MEPENEFLGFDLEKIPEPENIEEVIYSLMVNPNLTPLNYFNDFSEIVPDTKKIGADSDEFGIFEIEDGKKLLAMTTHAMHHHLESDPQKAAEILVSRATRKMVCYGASPIAISAMLYHINYSDPNEQFIASGAKVGLENASKAYNLKISDRKIRFDFFGEIGQQSPTMIVSLLGSLKKGRTGDFKSITPNFKQKGNNIFLIGKISDDISTSDYLELYHGITDSPLPEFDLAFEAKVINVVNNLIEKDLIINAAPIAKGGVFFTLLRSCWLNGLGFDITTAAEVRTDSFLFGESMGRIVVGVSKEKEDEFVDFMFDSKVPFFTLGHVTRGEIRIDDISFGFIDKMTGSL
jgi:phosphoribosylformylglycinamidine synthase subunit PurL